VAAPRKKYIRYVWSEGLGGGPGAAAPRKRKNRMDGTDGK